MDTPFPLLDTPRLHLREIALSDADALFAIHSDAPTMRWFGSDPLTHRDQAEQMAILFAGWYAAGTGIRWGIQRRDDARLIGTCGFFRWNKNWHCCLIGCELAVAMQGQGYMREALTAILAYGFQRMALHRIQAETHRANANSIALLNRLGFQLEGVHREQGYWNGEFHDLNCYALLAPTWNAAQE